MRIVNREEFLELPSETVFCKYQSGGGFGPIQIKTGLPGMLTDDFQAQELFDVDTQDADESDDYISTMMKAEEGQPFKLHFHTVERDGEFDDEQLFAIFDKDEIRKLADRLLGAWQDQPVG
jgi:hypothetical protein